MSDSELLHIGRSEFIHSQPEQGPSLDSLRSSEDYCSIFTSGEKMLALSPWFLACNVQEGFFLQKCQTFTFRRSWGIVSTFFFFLLSHSHSLCVGSPASKTYILPFKEAKHIFSSLQKEHHKQEDTVCSLTTASALLHETEHTSHLGIDRQSFGNSHIPPERDGNAHRLLVCMRYGEMRGSFFFRKCEKKLFLDKKKEVFTTAQHNPVAFQAQYSSPATSTRQVL